MDEHLVLIENVGDNRDDTVYLPPSVDKVLEKYRYIVIRILARVAAGARSEQHYPLQPVTVDLVERGAEAFQDRIVGRCLAQRAFPMYRRQNTVAQPICECEAAVACSQNQPLEADRK